MNSTQVKRLLQLLGLASLGYGLYIAWDQYRQVAGLATAFLGTGNQARSMFDGFMNSMHMGLGDLAAKQPWVWIGAALVIAPYLIGLGNHIPQSNPSSSEPTIELFVNCAACGEGVHERAPFCPHCGAARG